MRLLILIILFLPGELGGRVLQSYADIIEEPLKGVVNIRAKKYAQVDPRHDIYEFFLHGKLPKGTHTTSLGSGVVLDSEGHIITNYHVIKDTNEIEILFVKSKKRRSVRIVGIDRQTDIALLQVKKAKKLHPLSFGDSSKLRVGDVILAIGNPFGYAHTVTQGIISAKGRVIGTGPFDSFLQTDAAINPGNSGGAIIDMRGRLVGIASAINSKGSGIGFAIPINMVKNVIADLKAFGKVKRPWFGLVGKNILAQEDVNSMGDPKGTYGVVVNNIIVDGPAHQAGIRIGDLIMGIDKKKIRDLNTIHRLLLERSTTDTVRVKLYRRNKGAIFLTVDLRETPKSSQIPKDYDLF